MVQHADDVMCNQPFQVDLLRILLQFFFEVRARTWYFKILFLKSTAIILNLAKFSTCSSTFGTLKYLLHVHVVPRKYGTDFLHEAPRASCGLSILNLVQL